ncbi:hypothetical protein HY837_03920 [archaeon]|nr:hypothetical protein [archaeon]
MNIDFDALKSAVDGLFLDGSHETLEYFGRTYFVTSSPDLDTAVWFAPTYYTGADIYFCERIPEKFKGPVVLHEILEADLRVHQELPLSEAHKIAVIHDSLYAKQKLTEQDFLKYEKWRKKQKVKK